MNWVPGNLHLIGKDNQNNSPLQKGKTSSRPPTLTLCSGMQEQWWGGKADKMLYSSRDSDFTESQSLQKQKCFCSLVLCQLHITLPKKRKDNMVRWHLCFSFLPSYPLTVQGPEGVRTVLKRWSLTFLHGYALPASPSAQTRQCTY